MKPWSTTFKDRPLSWSQLSTFAYDKEQWYKRYVLGEPFKETPETIFGNLVDKKLQTDLTFHPEIKRHSRLQHKFKAKFGKIHMIGFADSYEPPKKVSTTKYEANYFAILDDYKTGKKAWTQERADETGQLTMYAFFLWLIHKIPPERVRLGIYWIPTQENGDFTISQLKNSKPLYFPTKRTMKDVLQFGVYINKTVKEMEAYVKNHD